MSDDRFFFKNLEEKYSDLLKVSVRKKYIFLIPSHKYVTPNMQNRSFYENHTFYQSEYDFSLFVSLNGKVLQQEKNTLKTFLGYKKEMVFNIIEELLREVNIQGVSSSPTIKAIYIDNVVEESCYNPAIQTNSNKKECLTRYNTKEEYLSYFRNSLRQNSELKEIENNLNETTEKMINNYILIKNHIETYAMHFQQEFSPLKSVSIYFY